MQPRLDIVRKGMTATAVSLIAVVPMLGGCQEPLFPDNVPRSQYERYEALRGEAAPRYAPSRSPTGPRQPALRERLAPRDGY